MDIAFKLSAHLADDLWRTIGVVVPFGAVHGARIVKDLSGDPDRGSGHHGQIEGVAGAGVEFVRPGRPIDDDHRVVDPGDQPGDPHLDHPGRGGSEDPGGEFAGNGRGISSASRPMASEVASGSPIHSGSARSVSSWSTTTWRRRPVSVPPARTSASVTSSQLVDCVVGLDIGGTSGSRTSWVRRAARAWRPW